MKLDLKKKYQRISNDVIGGEEDRGMRLEDIWKKRRMVELGLDPTNQDFLPDNDTVYVDEGQFTSSSILHTSSFCYALLYSPAPYIYVQKQFETTETRFRKWALVKVMFPYQNDFYLWFIFGVLRVIFKDS